MRARYLNVPFAFLVLVLSHLHVDGKRYRHYRSIGYQDPRIIGGAKADIRDAPYTVALIVSPNSFTMQLCGGSIISANTVLTAGHCVERVSLSSMVIRAGSNKHTEGGQEHRPTKFITHPKHRESDTDYDVAIIRVSPTFQFSASIKAIEIVDSLPAEGEMITMYGWGETSPKYRKISQYLRSVSVPTISMASCKKQYPGQITDRMFCHQASGKDACQGDSGGPVVVTESRKLAGVTSWGNGCARPGNPGVNTNLNSKDIRNWIKSQTGK